MRGGDAHPAGHSARRGEGPAGEQPHRSALLHNGASEIGLREGERIHAVPRPRRLRQSRVRVHQDTCSCRQPLRRERAGDEPARRGAHRGSGAVDRDQDRSDCGGNIEVATASPPRLSRIA